MLIKLRYAAHKCKTEYTEQQHCDCSDLGITWSYSTMGSLSPLLSKTPPNTSVCPSLFFHIQL